MDHYYINHYRVSVSKSVMSPLCRKFLSKTENIETNVDHCPILLNFKPWAKFSKFLGFFPVQNDKLICLCKSTKDNKNRVVLGKTASWKKFRRRYISVAFVLSFLIFIYFSTSILQPLGLYINIYIDTELSSQPTDDFAFSVFLSGFHIIRALVPIFPIVWTGPIVTGIRKMAKYDKKFNVEHGAIRFIDCATALLILGSAVVLVTNYIVAASDFVDKITNDDDPVFPLSYLLTQNTYVTAVLIEAGHVYAEISICFVVAVMRYISKFIADRMKRIEMDIKQRFEKLSTPKPRIIADELDSCIGLPLQSVDGEMNKPSVYNSCEKLEILLKLLNHFNSTFRGYFLGFFVFTVTLVIVSLYMIMILIRWIGFYGGLVFLSTKSNKVKRGFNALWVTGIHCVYRMILMINVGERIQNSVSGI